jgi:IclR family acetate operon transcriptional repressor
MSTVDKAHRVLMALRAGIPASLATLERETKIPKPTVLRLVRNLVELDLVDQDADGLYRLGPQLFSLAGLAYRGVAPTPVVREVIVKLAQRVHLTVHVSALRGSQLVYVDKCEADKPFQLRSEVGRLQSLHSSAIGKSILAGLPEEEARQLLLAQDLVRYTKRTHISIDTILAELPSIRSRGFAIDDEEDESSTRAIGAALHDRAGHPTGGISIVAPTFDITRTEIEGLAPTLKDAVAQIESSGEAFAR